MNNYQNNQPINGGVFRGMNNIREAQIDRLNKYTPNNKFISSSIIRFDIETLKMIASYVLTISPTINRQALSNVSILFDVIDLNIFNSDIEKIKYIDVIKKGVSARLSSGSNNLDVIITMIRGGIVSDSDNDEYTQILKTLYSLNSDEICFVNSTIESCLSYLNISKHAPKFIELLSDIENNKSNTKVHSLINEFNSLANDYINKTRSIEANMNSDVDFMLSKKELDLFIDDYLFKCENMADKIITGMQEFNTIIGGGFERERCYVFAGLAGIGKSMTILNLMKQIIDFNKNLKTLDSTKKPIMVFITQENSTFETMERFLEILGCENPRNTSKDEIMFLLKQANFVTEVNENENDYNFQVLIKFVPGGSENTDYLYTLYDDLYQKGYEVVVLVQDHIKKMRSSLHAGKDLRIELGEIVNEFKTFATIKKCVVITVAHLNRAADTKIKDSLEKGSNDPLKDIGRDAIGESYLLIDNSDCCLFMHKIYDSDNTTLMCFNRVKERFKVDPFKKYIAHPMYGPTLLPDLHLPEPLSRMSVNVNSVENSLNMTMDKNNNIHNTIGKYDEKLGRNITESDIVNNNNLKLVTMDDIFNSGNSYTSNIMNIPELLD